jgi:hypothetical protein
MLCGSSCRPGNRTAGWQPQAEGLGMVLRPCAAPIPNSFGVEAATPSRKSCATGWAPAHAVQCGPAAPGWVRDSPPTLLCEARYAGRRRGAGVPHSTAVRVKRFWRLGWQPQLRRSWGWLIRWCIRPSPAPASARIEAATRYLGTRPSPRLCHPERSRGIWPVMWRHPVR